MGRLTTAYRMRLRRKRELYKLYLEKLKGIEVIKGMPEPSYGLGNYWLSNIGFAGGSQAEAVLHGLRSARIEASPLWKPMHLQVINRDLRFFGNAASLEIHRSYVSLPSGSNLSDQQVERITALVREHLPVA